MPAVPLGVEAYARHSAHTPPTRLVNLYMEEDKSQADGEAYQRLQRPGLTRIATLTQGVVRGLYQSDNTITKSTIVVAGTAWFTLDDNVQTAIGTVLSDGGTVRMAATFERIGLISAGAFYIWDGTTVTQVQIRDTLTEDDTTKTLSALDPIVDFDVLNGYFLVGTATGKSYWLVAGETSIQALNYATAEALPDGLTAIRRLRDNLYLIGAQSIETWQATGNADIVFAPAVGVLIDRGCTARDSVALFDNSLFWVGDDSIVYRLSDVPTRVSNFGIEEALKKRTAEPSAWVFTSYGHKFYVLSIPGQATYAYDASSAIWSEFATLNATVWAATLGIDTPTDVYAADSSGGLFTLTNDSSLDDGVPFERLVTGTVPIPPVPAKVSSLAVSVGTDIPATFSLRWNDPRKGWSNPITLYARGEGDILNAWRLGAARAPSRTFEISTVSPAVIRISGAMANEAWRV